MAKAKAQVRLYSGPKLVDGVPTIWVAVGQDTALRAVVLGESELLRLLENTAQCLRDLYVDRFRGKR